MITKNSFNHMDLVLFGIQGSGKGTQAKRLAQEQGYAIFETGAELRKIAASGTELGQKIASYIDHGHLAPIDVVMEVVRVAVESYPADQKLLFDGIPRDIEQMQSFDAMMSDLGRTFTCIELTVDEEQAVVRIKQRAVEQGRADDASEEFIRRRMGIFHEKTRPVIDAYAAQGKVVQVSGEGTMDEVYERILEALSVAL
jgi:adenylate kinase